MFEIEGKYNTAKVFTDLVEETAIEQLRTLMDQEFVKDSTVRIMPDVHAGLATSNCDPGYRCGESFQADKRWDTT